MQTLIEKLEVLLEAAKTKQPIQELRYNGWYEHEVTSIIPSYEVRLKPTPKLRPWRLEEVPLGGWFRVKGFESAKRIEMVQSTVAQCVCVHHPKTLIELLRDYEWTLTPFDSASWKPCGVEE